MLLEHPAVAEAGVIGKPDPMALEIVKAFVALKPGTNRPMRCDRSCSASLACGWAPPSRPRRSISVRAFPRTEPARSCAGCSRRRNWGCPKATPRHWRRHERQPRWNDIDRSACRRRTGIKPVMTSAATTPSPVPRDAPHSPLRGEVCRAVQRRQDSRVSPSVHR